jgi:tetratricopeptide (TPR) repeat protein
MFFSLSTTPVRSPKKNSKEVTLEDRFISLAILLIWVFLISFAIVSITRPQWLIDISQSEKNEEAMSMKRFGDRYLENNDYKKAAIHYNAALKIQPDNYYALGNLAVLYSKTRNYNKAITILKKMIELKPEVSYIAEKNLAEIYEEKGILDKAIEYYSSAAEKAPYPSHLYTKLGILYCNTNNCTAAVEAFRSSISIRSDMNTHFSGMLERDYYRISDRPETRETIILLLEKGVPENELNRFDLTAFNLDLLRDKEYAISFNNLGWSYEQTGQLDKALINYQNAIKLYPRYLQARNNLDALKGKMEESQIED